VTVAVRLEGVGKRFRQVNDSGLLLKRLMSLGRGKVQEIWALSDVDLVVDQGESVGVIGRNGSGKTTMLKLIAGVSAPTAGRVRVLGSIAPLIGVGVGFDLELTGRENVFANGRILGMSPGRLRQEFDDIVAFSELEDFIDVPVKFYSTGMFLRLAFAVAIHVEPDVLLVDEVLAVGDIAFQAKCMERMQYLRKAGTTIVVVTHSPATLHRMCERSLLLSYGRVVFDGPIDRALSAYHEILQREQAERAGEGPSLLEEHDSSHQFVGGSRVAIEMLDDLGRPTRHSASGATCIARITATFEHRVRNPVVGVVVGLPALGAIYMASTHPGDYLGDHGPEDPLVATVEFENRLLEATYHVVGVVLDTEGEGILGKSPEELFSVTSKSGGHGLVELDARFSVGERKLQPVHLGLVQSDPAGFGGRAVGNERAPRPGPTEPAAGG